MRAKLATILIVVSVSFAYLFWSARPDGLLHIFVLNVGQGDAILIRTPNGTNVLIDGSVGNTVISELGDVLPYFDRTIDYVILTHPDRDHLEGLIAVAKRMSIGRFYLNGAVRDNFLVKDLLETLKLQKIPVVLTDATKDILLEDGTFFDFIYPFQLPLDKKDALNNTSIVIKMSYGTTSILFTGDIEAPTEKEIIAAKANIKTDILKVAHHGSRSSSIDEFLDLAQPKLALISVGQGNSFGHPHKETLDNLSERKIKVHRTDLEGRIEVIISPTTFRLRR